MSYEKIGWVSGETPLSAANLNHMEEGIANVDSAAAANASAIAELNSKTIKVVRYNTSSLTIAAGAETCVTMSVSKLLNKNLVCVYADGASPISNLAQLFVIGFSHVANSKEVYIMIKNKYTSSLTTVLQLAFYYY